MCGLRNRSAVVFKNTNNDVTSFYFRQFFRALTDDSEGLKKSFFNLQYLCNAMSDYYETSGYVYLALNKDMGKK